MRVFVTGAAGYIASVLVPELLKMEDVEKVTGIDIKPVEFDSEKFVFHKTDVRDPEITELIKGHDIVIHLAFIVTPRGSEAEMDSINIHGTKNVFYSSAKAGVRNLIYTSSIAAYGADPDHKLPLREDSPLKPTPDWYYSRAKGEIEFFISRFKKRYRRMRITIFRPALLIGPNINNPFGDLFRLPFMPDFGYDTMIEWVYDRDVVRAIILAIEKGKSGIYNIGGGNPLTMCEIAKIARKKCVRLPHSLILGVLKVTSELGLINRGYYQWLNKPLKYPLWMDSTKARVELGWKPTYDSAGAIKHFLENL